MEASKAKKKFDLEKWMKIAGIFVALLVFAHSRSDDRPGPGCSGCVRYGLRAVGHPGHSPLRIRSGGHGHAGVHRRLDPEGNAGRLRSGRDLADAVRLRHYLRHGEVRLRQETGSVHRLQVRYHRQEGADLSGFHTNSST